MKRVEIEESYRLASTLLFKQSKFRKLSYTKYKNTRDRIVQIWFLLSNKKFKSLVYLDTFTLLDTSSLKMWAHAHVSGDTLYANIHAIWCDDLLFISSVHSSSFFSATSPSFFGIFVYFTDFFFASYLMA